MPLWPMLAPVLRYALANVDFKFIYDRLSAARVRRVPYTRAHVVDALNAVLPAARATWTPQALFLFIAAFAKVRVERSGAAHVEWIHTPETVVAFISRGLAPAAAALVADMLSDECTEVFETLVAIAPQARRTSDRAAETDSLGAWLRGQTIERFSERQLRVRDRNIAKLLAGALQQGGLSTNECRNLLLAHEIAARDVDAALRSPEARPSRR